VPGQVIYKNTPGGVETGAASNASLNNFISDAAIWLNLTAVIKSGDRGADPTGSNERSEHRTDLGGQGALDLHLYRADGTQVPDRTAARWLAGLAGETS